MPDERYRSTPDELLPGQWKNALTVTFTPTAMDYLCANYALKNRSAATWGVYFLVGVFPLLVLTLFLLLTFEFQQKLIPDALWIPGLLLCGPLLMFVIVPVATWVKVVVALHNTPAAQGPTKYMVGEDGVCIANGLTRTEMKWPTFLKVAETGRFFLFYISPQLARFLPKRALPDPDDLHELRQILRANLGDKAYLRREND
jgi:hypothetical protein